MTQLFSYYKDFSHNRTLRGRIASALISGSLILVLVYVYSVGSITFSLVARKAVEQKISVLTADISALELSYLVTTDHFDKTVAYQSGFEDPSQVYFAERPSESRFSYLNDVR